MTRNSKMTLHPVEQKALQVQTLPFQSSKLGFPSEQKFTFQISIRKTLRESRETAKGRRYLPRIQGHRQKANLFISVNWQLKWKSREWDVQHFPRTRSQTSNIRLRSRANLQNCVLPFMSLQMRENLMLSLVQTMGQKASP